MESFCLSYRQVDAKVPESTQRRHAITRRYELLPDFAGEMWGAVLFPLGKTEPMLICTISTVLERVLRDIYGLPVSTPKTPKKQYIQVPTSADKIRRVTRRQHFMLFATTVLFPTVRQVLLRGNGAGILGLSN